MICAKAVFFRLTDIDQYEFEAKCFTMEDIHEQDGINASAQAIASSYNIPYLSRSQGEHLENSLKTCLHASEKSLNSTHPLLMLAMCKNLNLPTSKLTRCSKCGHSLLIPWVFPAVKANRFDRMPAWLKCKRMQPIVTDTSPIISTQSLFNKLQRS